MKPTIIAAALACALLAGCTTTAKQSPIDDLSLQEGLVRVDSKVADAVYRRPEARMSTYSKVLLRPIEVQFAKNWDPSKDGSALYRMNEPDREKIKTELADLFHETFKKELEKGNYPVVTTAAADVVEIQAAIVNLYINAPDVFDGLRRTQQGVHVRRRSHDVDHPAARLGDGSTARACLRPSRRER
jgi:hypothetical protein